MQARFGRRVFLVAIVGVLGTTQCASRQEAPPNPTVETVKSLQGNWRLKSFTPQKPLEQPFQGLLDAQLKAMTIAFSENQYFASGPGVNVQGRFEVGTAIGSEFQATFFDPEGIAYPVSGRFRGAELDFQSHNERWRGSGVLERAQAAR
jgi:hypothetical protein